MTTIRGERSDTPAGSPRAIARSYLESFAGADPDAVAAHVADDFVNEHTSALGSGSVGRDDYRRRLPGFLATFAGLHYEVEQVIGTGPEVAVPYRLTATVDGHPVDLRGVMILRIAGGLITRRTDYWDALTFLNQTDPNQPGLDQPGLDQTSLDQTGADLGSPPRSNPPVP